MPVQTSELLQPIAGSNPGGSDIRYEPIFDQIKRARVEEADLPTGDWSRNRKTADYAQVIKLGNDVLTKQSKDLQIAVWVAEALLKREGFGGFKSGLELLTSLLSDFWDHLYPQIEEGDLEFRVAPLQWVGQYMVIPVRMVGVNRAGHTLYEYADSQRIGYEPEADTYEKQTARKEALEGGKISAEQWDESFAATPKAWYKDLIREIDGSHQALNALEQKVDERFAHLAPRFSPLRDSINEVRQVVAGLLTKKLVLDPDPPDAEPMLLDASGALLVDPTAGGLPSVPRSRADAEMRIAAAARFLRAENSAEPAAYLLLRGFRWGELRARAGHVDPKLLAAPPTELRSRLRGMLLDAKWPELLEAGEDVMATPFGRGWLDLQRYVLTACGGLGSDYDQVASAISGALQSLLRDVPQLTALVLMDDTPTANAETLNWLRELNLGADDAPAPALREAIGDGRSSGRALIERALQRVRAGEPEKAIELLLNQVVQERSARERFMRRAQAARIMVDIGRDAVAIPILEDLLKEIDTHGLEQWEDSEIVALPLGLMYRSQVRTQGENSESQNLYLRICRLDPLQALKIIGTPGNEQS